MSTLTELEFDRIKSSPELRESFNNFVSHPIFEGTEYEDHTRSLDGCAQSCKDTASRWLAEHPAPEVAPTVPEVAPIGDPPTVVDDNVTITRAEYERLTREATRTFSRYDERMRPMFFNAARIANEADFCSEYDRIAGAVGAPSRDEFFTREFTFEVDVEITRTVSVTVSSTGSDEDDAWDSVDNEMIREALQEDVVEYDDFDFNSYSDVTEGDLVEL